MYIALLVVFVIIAFAVGVLVSALAGIGCDKQVAQVGYGQRGSRDIAEFLMANNRPMTACDQGDC